MKKKLKTSLLTLSLVSIMTLEGFAINETPSNIIIDGTADGLVSIPDDTFLEYFNMLPGDKESGIVNIKNSYDESYELYLKAQRVTPKEEYDLLDKIELKVTYKDEVIYEGPVSGEEGMEEDIYLGTYNPGEEGELLAEIELDGPTTTNEYKNKFAQVDWIFTATREENVDDNYENDDEDSDGGHDNDTEDNDDKYEDNTEDTDDGYLNNNQGTDGKYENDTNVSYPNPPKTGDSGIIGFLVVGAACLGLLYKNKK